MVGAQLRDQVVDLRGATLADGVGGDRGEGLAAEDVFDEGGEVAARAGFHEESHAVRVHRLDHPRELDRVHPVVHGQVADRIRIGGEAFAGGTAVGGRVAWVEGYDREDIAKRLHPRFEERRVIRPSEREALADGAAFGQRRFDGRDFRRRTDRHALMRAVVHRDHRALRLHGFGHRYDGGLPGPDREQSHIGAAGLVFETLHHVHRLDELRTGFFRRAQDASRHECREFARAVSRHGRHGDAEVAEQVRHRDVGNEYAEDGRPEFAEFGFGRRPLLEGRIRRRMECFAKRVVRATGALGEFVAPRERLLHFREDAAEVREHVEVLSAFAGVQEGDGALLGERLREEVDAVAVADLHALRVGEALGGTTDFREKVRGGTRDEGDPRINWLTSPTRKQGFSFDPCLRVGLERKFRSQCTRQIGERQIGMVFEEVRECEEPLAEVNAIRAADDEDFGIPAVRGRRERPRSGCGESGTHRISAPRPRRELSQPIEPVPPPARCRRPPALPVRPSNRRSLRPRRSSHPPKAR